MRFNQGSKKIVSSIISLIIVVSMIVSVNVVEALAALEGDCGVTCKPNTVRWSLDENTGVFTVSGEGEMYNYGSTVAGWDNYRDLIKQVIIKSGVNDIGDVSFKNCRNLKSVVIENGVKRIGTRAFIGCRALESVTIPDSVTEIEKMAFYGCISLNANSLNIPQGTTVGEDALNTAGSYEILIKTKNILIDYFDKLKVDNNTTKEKIIIEMDKVVKAAGGEAETLFDHFNKINATINNKGSIEAKVWIFHKGESDYLLVNKVIDKLASSEGDEKPIESLEPDSTKGTEGTENKDTENKDTQESEKTPKPS